MVEQYLQDVVQEMPHGRAKFCGDHLLGDSRITSGVFNQVMAAAVNAIESSGEISTFGSVAPSIDVYTYVGCTQDMTIDAAADGVDEVYDGTTVWKESLRRAQ